MQCDIVRLSSVDDKYDIIAEIGKGTYGKVYKCRDRSTATIVALKKINILDTHGGFPINTIREINLLRSLHHDNVIGLRAIVTASSGDESSVYLAFDYCEFDLYGLLYAGEMNLLSEVHVISYIKQLLIALKICHDNHIVHRDLKPANQFVTRKNVLRLGDFGLARKIVQQPDVRYTSNVITLYYRAPELLLDCKNYGYEVDMWSLGCIIFEMMTKKPLFQSPRHSNKSAEQLDAIWAICGYPDREEWPEFEQLPGFPMVGKNRCRLPNRLRQHLECTIPEEFGGSIDLLLQLLQLNPSRRISAEQAALHPFIRRYGAEIEASRLAPIASAKELHQMAVSAEKKRRQNESKVLVDLPKPPDILDAETHV
jgi:serine/threonine protein kinase